MTAVRDAVFELSAVPGVRLALPADDDELRAAQATWGVHLPDAHLELLQLTNGVIAEDGHNRFFGIGATAAIDMVEWNSEGCWKFAWHGRADPYLCFGEDVWGNQYAYRFEDLRSTAPGPPLWFLGGIDLTPFSMQRQSFEEFLTYGFVRNAQGLVDNDDGRLTKERFPVLGADELLVPMPPGLLMGVDDQSIPAMVDRAEVMSARVAMIVNGDVCTQLNERLMGRLPDRFEVVEDEQGRTRLKLVWDDPRRSPFN